MTKNAIKLLTKILHKQLKEASRDSLKALEILLKSELRECTSFRHCTTYIHIHEKYTEKSSKTSFKTSSKSSKTSSRRLPEPL